MEGNVSDKEQVEMLKKFWNDYGKFLLIAIVVGLGLGFGWRYWRQSQVEYAQQASVIYQNLAVMDAKKKFEQTQKIAAKLMKDYKRTPYASLAALVWAREAVQLKQFDVAKEKLQWVVKNSKTKVLKELAQLRLSRILLMQKDAKGALAVLKSMSDDMFKPMVETIRGDAYALLNEKEKSHKSYLAAKAAYKSLDLTDPVLNMKLSSGG